MAKKEFMYRGKSLDELKELSLTQLSELFTAAARRKIKRGFTPAEKIFLEEITKKDGVKTHCRDMIVLPLMVGKLVKVHRGNAFDDVRVTKEMIGHRLGEYSLTRKRLKHGSAGVGASRSSANVSRK